MVFQEDKDRPAARISMQDLPYSTLNDVINANKYLQLPRLSSQVTKHIFFKNVKIHTLYVKCFLFFEVILDSLCPPESSKTRRLLCVILVTDDREEDDEVREQLRKFTRETKFNRDRVTFAYIYRDKQTEFMNALSQGTLLQKI